MDNDVDNKKVTNTADSTDVVDSSSEHGEGITTKSKKKFNMKFLPWIMLVLVVVAGSGTTLYYRNRASEAENNPSAIQEEKNQVETDRVLTALKKVLFVGEQEAPTVARVEDPAKLIESNREFYKDVQQGDYLVILPKRAIIFRESAGQVMNVAPIINTADLQQRQAESSEQPAAESDNNTR